ncbi:hypothetical protein [Caulobacter endophyticus]|uniref:Uncharacterized protein n=1 Tax=Caulobacter endophyticus TaxID=2172652 RepID=A0A2T9K414_9CAUL|nr:hypothetical protein [Caulobacter endophyticus]PVM90687.1 hypothetical protein DDF67_09665 [Caulobacter endophyticus]
MMKLDHIVDATVVESEKIAAQAQTAGVGLGFPTHVAGVPILLDALAIAAAEMIGPIVPDTDVIATGRLLAEQFGEMLAVRCEQVRARARGTA